MIFIVAVNDIHSICILYSLAVERSQAGSWHRYPPTVTSTLEGVYCEGGRMVTISVQGGETKVDLWDTALVRRVPDDGRQQGHTD